MRPRFEETSTEYKELLQKALELEDLIAKKEKEGSMPDYTGQEAGATVGSHRFETQPGKVPNAFYNTNNVTLSDVEDVPNKGATMENSNVLDKNPHYPTAFSTTGALENFTGEKGAPVQKSLGGNIEKFRLQELKKKIDVLSSRIL